MTFIQSIVNNDSCCWAVILVWISLIVLCILFLRANITSNTRWEGQKFRHDKNLSGIYSGGFWKLFGLEFVWIKFSGFLSKVTLCWITQCITLYHTTLCSNVTSTEEKARYHRKCGNVLTFSERYSRCTMTQLKYFV